MRTISEIANRNATFIHIPKTAGQAIINWFKQSPNVDLTYRDCPQGHPKRQWYDENWKQEKLENVFVVVRNPWSRLVSGYLYTKYGSEKKYDRSWFVRKTFEEFVRNPSRHYLPQDLWYKETDTILKHENLKEDFKLIQNFFNDHRELETYNVTNVNKENFDWRTFYDEPLKEFVKEKYAKEIEFFGYEYDA